MKEHFAKLKKKRMHVTMEDGSMWSVPVWVIALHHASFYSKEKNRDANWILEHETVPLFNEGSFEIEDWATSDMNWSDVEEFATCIEEPKPDYAVDWVDGDKMFYANLNP